MGKVNFRVVMPRKASELLILSTTILAKHKEDGASSPLQLIDMSDFEAKIVFLTSLHAQVEALRRESESTTEQRNLTLGIKKGQTSKTEGTVYYYITAVCKLLTGLYYERKRKLGDWGFEVANSSQVNRQRVPIRRTPDGLVQLGELILAKHAADGSSSPLHLLQIGDMIDKVTRAKALQIKALQQRRDIEKFTETRDQQIGIAPKQSRRSTGTLLYYIVSVRHILSGIHLGREQRLGDWGFEVNTSSRKKEK